MNLVTEAQLAQATKAKKTPILLNIIFAQTLESFSFSHANPKKVWTRNCSYSKAQVSKSFFEWANFGCSGTIIKAVKCRGGELISWLCTPPRKADIRQVDG
jgi:hypothetical protein